MTGLFGETESDRRGRETDTADRGDDPTPRELARTIIEAAAWRALAGVPSSTGRYGGPPVPRTTRVLDVCAGYGCWSSEWRRWWVREAGDTQLKLTGIEIFEPRREHLAKWCDRVLIGDWREALRHEAKPFDIAIGNPDFKLLVDDSGDPDASMPAALLRHARAALLLHQTTNLQRGMAGAAVWRAYPPAHVWLVPGSVHFRGPGGGTDSRCYQASLWLRGHAGPTIVEMLPSPPDGRASWRWTVPPGSEEPSADLPAAPGWTATAKARRGA